MTTAQYEGNNRDAGVVEEICGYLTSHPPRSFFLFAGAGSGKTRTLVEVLRRLTGIEQHNTGTLFSRRLRARGQAMRVITYTRNAVTVINGRLGDNDLTKVSTIHSFCWDLIAGFDDDIREALLDLNSQKLKTSLDTASARKRGPTAKDQRTIEELKAKAETLQSTPQFIYHPDRNTYGEGALQHAQVLAVTAWLLNTRPTMRRILEDQHPVILIDESQDTMKGMLGALMQVAREGSSNLALGFLGDHRQRIYMDGHEDLPNLIPEGWARPKLEMNHRSQQRIVNLINRIWEAELDGRTQPANGVQQHSRTEKNGGAVQIFVGDVSLAPDEKIQREILCAEQMASASGSRGRSNWSDRFQVLALEHKLVARRGDFLDVYNAMCLIDPEGARPQGDADNNGPASVQVLMRELPAVATCIDEQGEVDEFAAIEVLNRFGRLKELSTDIPERQAQLSQLYESVKEFVVACTNPDSTVRDIMNPVIRCRLFEVDDRLARAFADTSPPPGVPKRPSDESTEDRKRRGWHTLFNARWREVERYRSYLEGRTRLATHQVVKGSQFKHVMVVMDDQEADGFLFSYDKLFGAVPLSSRDQSNVDDNKETTIDRTLRLLYVTCSRAEESLALILWSSDSEAALRNIKAGGWFSENEISRVPEKDSSSGKAPSLEGLITD